MRGNLSCFTRNVATTAMFNALTAGTAAVAGVIIARSLGPSLRGEYAAILAWFGTVHHIGQLGQTTATTFFVARHPQRAPDYVATARNIMTASGVAVLVLGLFAAPLLGRENHAMTLGYGLMFATCLPGFMGSSYLFSLQASSISRWNLARLAQPVLFLGSIAVLRLTGHLRLETVLLGLSITSVTQGALAYALCRGQRLTGGRADPLLARPMSRYGFSRLAASVPSEVALKLDQLVLSLAVAPALLGRYAVAVSLTAIAGPIVTAVGYVAFPALASRVLTPAGTARLQRQAVLASAGAGIALILPLVCCASWLVPAIYGAAYREAVPLVWLLAPSSIFFACGTVCSDLLLGHGRPLAVAWAQGAASVVTVGLMVSLLPVLGVRGAAIATTAGAAVAFLLMMRALTGPATQTVPEDHPMAPVEAPEVAADLPRSPPSHPEELI